MRLPHTLLLVFTLMLGSFPAQADPMACAELARLTKTLADGPAHLAPAARGTDVMGRPTLLFVGPTGSWMMAIILQLDGRTMACVQTAGEEWRTIAALPGRAS